MAYSLLRRPEQRTETEQTQLLQIQQADPLLATLATHTETFAQMVRERAAERLDPWLAGVLASPWCELKRFAQGLRQDYAAVQAALTSRYSNGPTEGHVTYIPHPLGGDRRIFSGAFLARTAIPSRVMLLSHERSCPQRLRPWRVVGVSFCRRSKRIKSNICPS
jgi:hypothetical protein